MIDDRNNQIAFYNQDMKIGSEQKIDWIKNA